MRIAVDAGHGGHDPGAVYHGLQEKDVNLNVALLLANELNGRGQQVFLTRERDEFVSLKARAVSANVEHVGVFISIHCNADADADVVGSPEASGYEVWHFEPSLRGLELAVSVNNALKHQQGIPSRGLKVSRQLYVLKHTKMPAILIELGFIDSVHDQGFLRDPGWQIQAAQLIAAGISDL